MASALHIQHDLCRIIDYDRADVQAMRCYRSKTETATLRNDDWSAIREIISRRTRRRGHDKTIRLIGNQKLAIHLRTDGYHRSIITFQHGDVIQGKRIARQDAALSLHLDDGMLLYPTFTSIETIQR